MFNRRSLVVDSTAFAAALSLFGGASKTQAAGINAKPPGDVEPRGAIGRLERLPELDLESRQDFMQGLTAFAGNAGPLSVARSERAAAILAARGLDPTKTLPLEQAHALFDSDPLIGMQDRLWYSAHNYEHDLLDGWFRRNADRMRAEMDAADHAGPGRLELDPTLAIPDYARHEIHQQPGGYVGNAFAGHIYHYATNMFYRGTNNQDERHLGYAAGCPLPRDGRVRRVLDLGCGIGQLTVAMKERFPEAEVIGLDLAAPMLRYGHMRASELGSDVTFTQRLAEDTRYPDGHFDVVISYIMFHEVTADASRKIIAEAFRVLRPGGVFHPMDFNQAAAPSAFGTYRVWKDHHWNNERWRLEYASMDFDGEMRKVGFAVQDQSEPNSGFGKLTGTKPA